MFLWLRTFEIRNQRSATATRRRRATADGGGSRATAAEWAAWRGQIAQRATDRCECEHADHSLMQSRIVVAPPACFSLCWASIVPDADGGAGSSRVAAVGVGGGVACVAVLFVSCVASLTSCCAACVWMWGVRSAVAARRGRVPNNNPIRSLRSHQPSQQQRIARASTCTRPLTSATRRDALTHHCDPPPHPLSPAHRHASSRPRAGRCARMRNPMQRSDSSRLSLPHASASCAAHRHSASGPQ